MTYPAPQEYPQPEKKASGNREDDGDKEVDKEGEEGPGDKGDDHHDQQDHVGAEPRDEEGSSVEHRPKEEEEGEEDMEDPGEDESTKQGLVMEVQPVEAPGNRLGNLQHSDLQFEQYKEGKIGLECVIRVAAVCEERSPNCYLSVPMVLHQPPLD